MVIGVFGIVSGVPLVVMLVLLWCLLLFVVVLLLLVFVMLVLLMLLVLALLTVLILLLSYVLFVLVVVLSRLPSLRLVMYSVVCCGVAGGFGYCVGVIAVDVDVAVDAVGGVVVVGTDGVPCGVAVVGCVLWWLGCACGVVCCGVVYGIVDVVVVTVYVVDCVAGCWYCVCDVDVGCCCCCMWMCLL